MMAALLGDHGGVGVSLLPGRLEGSGPDAGGMPTRLVGRYDEEVTIDEQSADCGFPEKFVGTWEWDLTSLDSSPREDAA